MPASAREAFATRAGLAACRSSSGRYNDAGTIRHLLAELVPKGAGDPREIA